MPLHPDTDKAKLIETLNVLNIRRSISRKRSGFDLDEFAGRFMRGESLNIGLGLKLVAWGRSQAVFVLKLVVANITH